MSSGLLMLDMYSRAGKTKSNIVTHTKTHKTYLKSKYSKSLIQKQSKPVVTSENVQEWIRIYNEEIKSQSSSPPPSHFFRCQSRSESQSAELHKNNPPCGYYTVKYNVIDRNRSSVTLDKQSKRKHRKVLSNDYGEIPKFPEKQLKLPISFNRQLPRQNKFQQSAHDLRFEIFNNWPQILSKAKRVQTPNFEKSKPRDPLFSKQTQQSIYSPNFNQTERKLSRMIPNFQHATGRESVKLQTDYISKTPSYSQVDRNVQTPNIKLSPRKPSHEVLPSFMVNSTSRMGIALPSWKTLQMN